jgi:hypothetical protein
VFQDLRRRVWVDRGLSVGSREDAEARREEGKKGRGAQRLFVITVRWVR